ncbi:CBS domain-containing protein [Sulfurimonas lithotrophica]|uniref:CBS domain-containing protein n=2 Tax=Sulfurimonas lithotrophica TaxID=2590022 RepID=A0A5P8NZP8_9BACT|nr:CBS domain-containing protein [Sulfurimonas lithotrophica]
MSLLDQRKLIKSIHPFDLLGEKDLDNLMGKIDIAYYTKDTLLISKNLPSIAFYIIIKGSVTEYIDDEIHNVYSSGDSFDADALIYEKTEGKFLVEEDLICYEIKKEDFLDLMQDKRVQGYFLQDFVSRHQNLKYHDTQSELTPFLMARVRDIYLHEACMVNEDSSILDSLKMQSKLKAKVIIVKKDDNYEIVTDTDLKEKVLLSGLDVNENISKISTSGIISIDVNDFLFNALLIMTHNEIKRLVVTDEDKIIGVLEQLDLLSYFANHSHLIAVQIDKAQSVEDLKDIQEDLNNVIRILKTKGVKTRYITKLVSSLNIKIYKKLFSMVMPEELKDECCLVVLGSEGRGEQIIKTDQDNALIIKDGLDVELFKEPMLKLNSYLLDLGFPVCPGNVMVSNEFWRRDVSGYKTLIKTLANSMDESKLQTLSIILDAKAAAGNEALLEDVMNYLHTNFHSRDDVLAHMAKAVLSFETPLSLFSSFVTEKTHNNKLDIKKGGIFALVHGIRTLSLQYEVSVTNTVERIKELNNKGVIDKNFATELIESFDTLIAIRLDAQSNDRDENYVNPVNLEKNQRDLLKDSFKIVNKFKKFTSFHFHLNMVV